MLAGFVGLEDGTANLRAFLFLGTETAPRHLTEARSTDALSLAVLLWYGGELFRLIRARAQITHSLTTYLLPIFIRLITGGGSHCIKDSRTNNRSKFYIFLPAIVESRFIGLKWGFNQHSRHFGTSWHDLIVRKSGMICGWCSSIIYRRINASTGVANWIYNGFKNEIPITVARFDHRAAPMESSTALLPQTNPQTRK